MDGQMSFEFEQRKLVKGCPELCWAGKRPYTSTQYYPAQLKEAYGRPKNGWMNKLFWGDNLQVMSHMLLEYRGQIDLVYIDPPFESKSDYKKQISLKNPKSHSDSPSFQETQYSDLWTNDEYLQFIYERLVLLRELLSENGSIFVHCDWHKQHYIRMIMDSVFGPELFKNEILWCYSIGGKGDRFFGRKHDTILWYTKTERYYFNGKSPYVVVGRKQNSHMKVRKDENGREYQEKTDRKTGKVYRYYLDEGKIPEDYWTDIEQLNREDTERNHYPTQKPEALLRRIIAATTRENDIVFDCFMGSGTTQAVAMKLGRRFIGADINLAAIQIATKRLLDDASLLVANKFATDEFTASELAANSFEAKESQKDYYCGFEVYHVNNYELFRNPVEAKAWLIDTLGIRKCDSTSVYDGEWDGWKVKIMPANRIATKADLEELKANLPYHLFERRKAANPGEAVERIKIICMGHEDDLRLFLEQELSTYSVKIEIFDILCERNRDRIMADLQCKREIDASVVREVDKLVVKAFYPMRLLQKLGMQKESVKDWRQLVEAVYIDWKYDGETLRPGVCDIPGKDELVSGIYDIPAEAARIRVKITDLLSDSYELEI